MTSCPQCTATIRFYANAIAEIEIGRKNAERERDKALLELARALSAGNQNGVVQG